MELFIGIDVAKAEVEIKESNQQETYSEKNNTAGIRRIVRRMVEVQPALVAMEATGGYEKPLARALPEHQEILHATSRWPRKPSAEGG